MISNSQTDGQMFKGLFFYPIWSDVFAAHMVMQQMFGVTMYI